MRAEVSIINNSLGTIELSAPENREAGAGTVVNFDVRLLVVVRAARFATHRNITVILTTLLVLAQTRFNGDRLIPRETTAHLLTSPSFSFRRSFSAIAGRDRDTTYAGPASPIYFAVFSFRERANVSGAD